MEPSDADLMRDWQAGDLAAFERLVRRWQGPVGRLLARLAGPAAAADLAQEVFLRVWLAGPRYREQGGFRTWLYRIALNASRDAARADGRRPPLVPPGANGAGGSPADTAPDREDGPHEVLCRREAVALVGRALAELPEPLREVLVLRHHEGMSFEDIARLTGTPASTLKSRFAQAQDRLRARLKHLGYGPEGSLP